MKLKYIGFIFASALVFTACETDDDSLADPVIDDTVSTPVTPTFTSGTADFSTFVALGNSLTAGVSDGTLFERGQEVSFPNILASTFALSGGGEFTQPLTGDDTGGLLFMGSEIAGPRLILNTNPDPDVEGENPAPEPLDATPTTEVTNIIPGPYNNMGVPSAKSFHLLAPGYGNVANFPAAANPYFVRMASSPDATVISDAMVQNPTFFSLWIGNNDVLGYATSGGDGSNPITDQATFDFAMSTLAQTLTSGGAEGIIANIPNVTDAPFFTTVPFAPLDPTTNEDFEGQVPLLNTVFGALNQIFNVVDPSRIITFSATEPSAVIIKDETLADLSATITGALNANPAFPAFVESLGLPAAAAPLVANLLGTAYGQTRQANSGDLLVLTSQFAIGTVNEPFFNFLLSQNLPPELAGQFAVEGVTYALDDKWVLLPSEQEEVAEATASFNATIAALATQYDLAFFDVNTFFNQVATSGFQAGSAFMTADYVTGGTFSLDGFHPSPRGYSVIANQMIDIINAKYGANLPNVNPVDFTGVYLD